MAAPPNVEMEAAKFLHQLIQDSKDEPSKLATKLYVILQHMRASGKENSMPYQVISRAMETVIGQHGLDIDALMSSRPLLNAGGHGIDSASSQKGGSSLRGAIAKEANASISSSELSTVDGCATNRPSAGPSSAVSHLNSAAGKVYGTTSGGLGPYAAAEPGLPSPAQFSSSFDNHGLARKDRSVEGFSVTPFVEGTLGKGSTLNSVTETGKSLISQSSTSTSSGMPFKDQHLKQLRAQCLVYLAFRNGLMPKKLHLDIALGNIFPKEDGPSKEMIDQKGKEQSVDGTPDVTIPFGRLDNSRDVERSHLGSLSNAMIADASLSREGDSMNMVGDKNGVSLMKSEVTGWAGNGCNDEFVPMPERNDSAPTQSSRLGDHNFQGSQHADAYLPSYPLREQQKPISRMDGGNQLDSQAGSKMVPLDNALLNANPFTVVETDQEEDNISVSTDLPPSAKYTTTEKWIRDHQKRKLLGDQRWALKQQKTNQRITKCADELKDKVSASEDISAKTKSVIELKKLQLLELQNRLRNDILNDFFKPITSDMDRLKSIKKHRIGRRSKQHERYEQKMKEERQKRFRERQKEFFSEIEAHKERVEDISKMRRERWKGFNRYAREFHKRKERVHREKIDRIQREKINLLKVNDVEGYLRMVQDAKSDRVKQLLKETEKYLQKLGSKLKDAKVMSRCFGTETDDNRSAGAMEKFDITAENEDETDQAKHYLESNEKYYLMAHSIKENVAEQPTCLVGGKLREYQMNGLRWLVSLYNNHLNGILADEMGLGKTVQVISLICYLMETKNDRGPFLVVVPSSVLPGWDSEINFWAPSINKIVYSGPPEERRRLFKERIDPQKFNVLLTTYEYLMNKHDRPKLSKIHWHYVIIDEGHRIKNASCKLNADLKFYRSSHRLLLTGTPLQNNLEELWALLNFLLPNIFNSSEDFSQWFNKPFESNGDSTADEALLSEEENLLIINRLHQVLRPFVLRRLKHKVENELPEKIERLVRCEASAYQKLLMKRVEDNLGALGTSKARSVHNSVMELRNICNHPYLSQLHSEEVHEFIPKHYLPNVVRLCGKLEMLDRILPKLKATNHRVLLFSTMTRLLDVMEDYLYWKQYKYLRLDGHTSGGDRGALIDLFNKPGSPYFIFLLSIRAGGVGVNLQAADTVIIFDTDWNPQVDLQAQARAHRIGQKREVLVLRFETVQTVEEQVRAAAEHKLGVANQSITAGFFDNNTSAEDRREYLESLLRESKKEEATPVLHDDALNDLIARSESEIDIFESVDRSRQEEEMAAWKLALGHGANTSEPIFSLPSRLVTDAELKAFSEAMKIFDAPAPAVVSNLGVKRKSQSLGGLDTQHYGRGKRAREVRSYEEQWTEDEFEKMCQVESPQSPSKLKDKVKEMMLPVVAGESSKITPKLEAIVSSCAMPQSPNSSVKPLLLQSVQTPIQLAQPSTMQSVQLPQMQSAKSPLQSAVPPPVLSAQPSFMQSAQPPLQQPVQLSLPQPVQSPLLNMPQRSKEVTPPSKRGRGRPKKATQTPPPSQMVVPAPSGANNLDVGSQRGTVSTNPVVAGPDALSSSGSLRSTTETIQQLGILNTPRSQAIATLPPTSNILSTPIPDKRRGRKAKSGGEIPQRGRKPSTSLSPTPVHPTPSATNNSAMRSQGEIVSSSPFTQGLDTVSHSIPAKDVGKETTMASFVPVHLPSSTTIKLSTESVVTAVSSSCILSDSILTDTVGPTRSLHVEGAGSQLISSLIPVPSDAQTITAATVTSSQPNLPFPSVLLPQSVALSQSIQKQVKGRGRRAKSEVEAPRRRGRKQDAVSSVVPDKSGDQEPTSIEPPDKKSRVSAGKESIVTRSKQPNEAQNLMNVIHAEVNDVHTSLGLAETKKEIYSSGYVAARSTDKESSQTEANQLDETISGDGMLSKNIKVLCQTSEGLAGKQIQNAGVKDVSPTVKEITGDNYQSSQIEICQVSSHEQVGERGVSKPSFVDVSVAQISDSKTEMPNIGTAPVSNLPIEVCGKEDGEKVQESIKTPSSVIVPSELGSSGSGRKRKVDVLFANTTILEHLTDTKVVGGDDLPGLVCSGTDTGVTVHQSLEEKKYSALLASETVTIIQSSDGNSRSLASNLRTDQVSDIITIASPFEKGSEKVEEARKPFNEGFVSPTPKVLKPESLKTASDFVQKTSVPGNSVEESLSNVDESKSVHYVGEKSLVSCTYEKLEKVNDAMAGCSEGVDRNEGKVFMDQKVKDAVRSLGVENMPDNAAGATNVLNNVVDGVLGIIKEESSVVDSNEGKVFMDQKVKDAVRSLGVENMPDNAAGATNVLNNVVDGVLGIIQEESSVVKTIVSDSNISSEYSGEKLGSEVNDVVAEVDNVKDFGAIENSEVTTEFGVNKPSGSKVEEGGPEYIEESHQLSEKGVIVWSKPKSSEESISLGAIENDKRDHVGGGLHVTKATITEIGEVKELLVGLGQKQEMECSKKEEFREKDFQNVEGVAETTERRDGPKEGVSETRKRRDDPAVVGTFDGEVAKTFANVKKVCDGLTFEAAERQGRDVLEGTVDATIEISQTVREFHVEQCLKQAQEVPERREHADEVVFATEAPDTKIEQKQTEILDEQSLAQPEVVKIFEKVEKVFEDTVHNERMEHHEGTEIPEVQKPESLENTSDFVQITSVPGKSVEGSLSNVNGNKSVHYLEEKTLVSCANEKLAKSTDAMTGISRGVDSNEGKVVMDQKVKDAVRSLGVENMPDNAANAAGATNVLNNVVDGVLGIIQEESSVVKTIVSDTNISGEYSGEKLGSEVNDVVAEVDSVKDFEAIENSEVTTEFGVNKPSESKVEDGGPEYMEEIHKLSEKGVIVWRKPKSSEESISLGAIESDKRDHVWGGLRVTKVTITEIGEVKELLVGLGQKQAMVDCSKKVEYREKDCQNVEGVSVATERKDGPTEGVSETTKGRDDPAAVGTLDGEETKPFANVKKLCDGLTSEADELQGSEVLEGTMDATIEITQTGGEFRVKQCLKQGEEVFQQASEPEEREHADEAVFATEAPDTKIEQIQAEIFVEQSLARPEAIKIFEKVGEVFVDTVLNKRMEHHEGTETPKVQKMEPGDKILPNVSESKVEVGQTLEEHLDQQHQTQSQEAETSELLEVLQEEVHISEGRVEVGHTLEEDLVQQHQTQSKEAEASELLEVLQEEVHDVTSEQEDIGKIKAITDTAVDVSQTMDVLLPEQCQTQAEEAKPIEEVEEVLLGGNAHCKNLQQTNTVLHAKATVEIGKRAEELLTEQCQTQADEAKTLEEVEEVLLRGNAHGKNLQQTNTVLHAEATIEIEKKAEELLTEQCQTLADEAKPLEEVEEVLLGGNAHGINLQQTNTVLPAEATVEIGKRAEELLTEQCRNQAEEAKPLEEAEEVLLGGNAHGKILQQTNTVLHAEATVEIGKRAEELLTEQCQTQADEAKPLEEAEEVLLGGNAHGRNLQQTNTVLPAEATVEIGTIAEELLTEQCQTQAAEVFKPSEIAVVLQEAVGQAVVTSDCIKLKAVGISESRAKHEVKDSDKVEAFDKVIELDKREENGGPVANIPQETIDEIGEMKQEGLMEHQNEVDEADRHDKVKDVSQEGTKNEGMEQEVGPTLTSVEKLTEELILPDQAKEKEGAIGSSEDLAKGIDDA